MSTIAFKDGVIAADSLVCMNEVRVASTSKIFTAETPDGDRYAVCSVGNMGHDQSIVEWVERGFQDPLPSMDENSSGIVIRASDGRVTKVYNHGISGDAKAPFYAWGSGFELALGAMAAGAGAVEAVEIACRFDIHSGGPVEEVSLTALHEVNP